MLTCVLFGSANYCYGQQTNADLIKRRAKKVLHFSINSVAPTVIDSVSKNGVYKIGYGNDEKKEVELYVVFVGGRVYTDIKKDKGNNQYYTKPYYKIMKYLTEEQMKEVRKHFFRTYPPNM